MQMKPNYVRAYQIEWNNINSFKEMFKALSHVTKSISSCKFHNKNKSILTINMKGGIKPFEHWRWFAHFPQTKTNELVDIYMKMNLNYQHNQRR